MRKNSREDVMPTRRSAIVMALSLTTIASPLLAQQTPEPIKIGIMVDFTGPFAGVGTMVRQGVDLYVAQMGSGVGGRQVELVYRDVNPATAKQVAEELVVKDKVKLFAGFALTPEAAAVAAISKDAKIPTVLVLPSTPTLMNLSPYFIRSANNMPATVRPSAEWSFKQGKRKAYIAVSDYAPGYELQAAFKKRFEELGGKVVAEDRIPLSTVDYAPFAERIAQSDADMVQVFIPPGAPAISFIRGLSAQGVTKKGVLVVGIGETNEYFLPVYDDSILGYHSSNNYSGMLTNPENVRFKAALLEKYGEKAAADSVVVQAYDAMHIIFKMIESQSGKPFDGAAAVEAVKGFSWNSPRGAVRIDPETRDLVQPYYIREVQRIDGKLQNVVLDSFPLQPPLAAQ
jgi:branched-chain amino acid transport system substrate-binding protein